MTIEITKTKNRTCKGCGRFQDKSEAFDVKIAASQYSAITTIIFCKDCLDMLGYAINDLLSIETFMESL